MSTLEWVRWRQEQVRVSEYPILYTFHATNAKFCRPGHSGRSRRRWKGHDDKEERGWRKE